MLSAIGMPAVAQPAEDFYAGKIVNVIVNAAPGSTYDVYSRMLAHYMPEHMPSHPTFIVKNMVGGGGWTGARYLYFTAPKDGREIGTIGRAIPFEPLFGNAIFKFDPLKFNWIGNMAEETSFFISWHTAKVKTVQDLFKHELLEAGSGAGSDSEYMPRAINALVGTKFKIISGYTGSREVEMALERGEVEGWNWSWSALLTKPEWVRDHKFNFLFQNRTTPHPGMKDVPLITSLAKTEEQREALAVLGSRDIIGRPYLAPPGIPANRFQILRTAFDATVKDPSLIAEAKKHNLDVDLMTGAQVEAFLRGIYSTPPVVVEMIRAAMKQ
jgi:tripartite-type tricarboxylate transporter receptor subunit TctC